MAKKKKNGRWFRRVAGESLMIIFSVLFALLINEWRNSVNDNRRTDVILENIEAEIRANQEITESILAYHTTTLDSIGTIYNEGRSRAVYFQEPGFTIHGAAPRGVMQDTYQYIAWEVARQERIATRVDFAMSAALYDAYEQQRTVDATINRIIDILSQREVHREELADESAIMLYLEFREVVGQEQNLLHKYERALELMEAGK